MGLAKSSDECSEEIYQFVDWLKATKADRALERRRWKRKYEARVVHCKSHRRAEMAKTIEKEVVTGASKGEIISRVSDSDCIQNEEDLNIIGFGKYADRTYADVVALDLDFCQFAMTEAKRRTASDAIRAFARYVQEKRPDVRSTVSGFVEFGRYRGESYEDVYRMDRKFCKR